MSASAVAALGLSSCGSWALELGVSSGTWAWLLHSMWNLLKPGSEPTLPADSHLLHHQGSLRSVFLIRQQSQVR